jgi:hypothetical protein
MIIRVGFGFRIVVRGIILLLPFALAHALAFKSRGPTVTTIAALALALFFFPTLPFLFLPTFAILLVIALFLLTSFPLSFFPFLFFRLVIVAVTLTGTI